MTATRAHKTYGGNRVSGNNVRNNDIGSWSATKPENRNQSIWQPGRDEQPTRTCPTCGLDIRVKVNGELGSHRVGTTAQRRWLCPGEDVAGTA